jgi:hypothetical protein
MKMYAMSNMRFPTQGFLSLGKIVLLSFGNSENPINRMHRCFGNSKGEQE